MVRKGITLKTFVLVFILIQFNHFAHSQPFSNPSNDSNVVVLKRVGEWSPESDQFSHTKCHSSSSDSLLRLIDSLKTGIWGLVIDSTLTYSFQFTKEISGRYDFMNRPVRQHECVQMADKKVYHFDSIETEFQTSNNQNIPQKIISTGVWLIVLVRETTWVGNSSEWTDYEYHFRKA
jgi:hypothetical protein